VGFKDISKAKELIAVNIPSYELTYFKKGQNCFAIECGGGEDTQQNCSFSYEVYCI
jgi:murein L,D-transpeptidase YcbB/YkuD